MIPHGRHGSQSRRIAAEAAAEARAWGKDGRRGSSGGTGKGKDAWQRGEDLNFILVGLQWSVMGMRQELEGM